MTHEHGADAIIDFIGGSALGRHQACLAERGRLVLIGLLGGARPGSLWDALARVLGLIGQAVPNFWLALLMIIVFAVQLRWFPAFGREGHALPLGRAVQHTGEIDAANPLEQLWVFGAQANSLDGFTQARIEADGEGGFTLRTAPDVEVVTFGA